MQHHMEPDRRAIEDLWEAVDRLRREIATERELVKKLIGYDRKLTSAFGAYKRQSSREFARLRREIAVLQDSGDAVAIRFTLTIGEDMPGSITVDTTNETATLEFVDDKGNPTTAPTGATFSYASSDDTVATVAPDSANPLQADITPVGLGTADISATSNGTAFEADGVTAIADPPAKTVTVGAGQAVGEAFVLSI